MYFIIPLRLKALRHDFRHLASQAKARLVFIVLFALGGVGGLFFLIWEGFNFLNGLGGLGTVIMGKLLYLFFSALFLMLIISSAVVTYLSFFRSRETAFLTLAPLDTEDIVYNKSLESMFLASWAFLFVILPFIYAYGVINKVHILYYFFCPLYFLPFIMLACLIGCLLCFFFIYSINARRLKFLFSAIIIFLCFYIPLSGAIQKGPLSSGFFSLKTLIPFFKITQVPFMPYYWVSQGLRELEQGFSWESLIYLSCLLSSFFAVFVLWGYIGKRLFPRCFQKTVFASSSKKYIRWQTDKYFYGFPLFPRWFKAFILKDLKNFLRDPLQWVQFLVFFGLLFVYFLNLRNFSYHLYGPVWKNLITFLNMFAVSCILAALGARFIFPQMSLEGRRFWILGLSPLSFLEILTEKFLISFLPSLILCEALIIASCVMLSVSNLVFVVSVFVVAISCVTIISMCTGLGAHFADFSKEHQLEVISEFGGILTLVLSLVYIIGVNLSLGVIFHLHLAQGFNRVLVYALLVISFVSILVTFFSFSLGVKALRRKEPQF